MKNQETKNVTEELETVPKVLRELSAEVKAWGDELDAGEKQGTKDVSQKMNFAGSLIGNVRKVLGDENSIVFVSGVLAGIELLKNKARSWSEEKIEEPGNQAEKSMDFAVKFIEDYLNGFQPDFQKAVLKVVMERQPERDALAAEENRRQEATDGLHEIIDNWPTEKVESLGRLLEDESLEEKLLQVA